MRSIQGLRALAALLVVCDHVPRLEDRVVPGGGLLHGFGAAGAIGVDLFFVISGFIMITTTWNAFGTPGAGKAFLLRRFLRIYPAYWVPLAVFLTVGIVFPFAQTVGPITFTSLFTSVSLVPTGIPPLMFVAWSLQFELYFYVVFAIALNFSRSRLPLILGTWCLATLLLSLAARVTGFSLVQFLGSPLPFEFMGGGAIGYLVLHERFVAPRTLLGIGTLLAVGVAVYSSRFDGFGSLDLAWFRVLCAGPAMMLIVYGVTVLEQRAHVEPPRLLGALGDASYTMYLWHGMLLGVYTSLFMHARPHGRLVDTIFLGGASLVVVCGSLALYRTVELPITRAVKRLFRTDRAPRAVVVPAP